MYNDDYNTCLFQVFFFVMGVYICAYIINLFVIFRFKNYIYHHPVVDTNVSPIGNQLEDNFIIPINENENIHMICSEKYDWIVENKATLFIYFHGNCGNLRGLKKYIIDDMMLKLKVVIHNNSKTQPFALIAMDYRGYGQSKGNQFPTTQTMLQDGVITLQWIQTHFPHSPLIIYGESIGSSVASYAISHLLSINQIQALILKSPFYNMKRLACHKFKHFVPSPIINMIVQNDYETNEYLKVLQTNQWNFPIIVGHSHDDELIPYEHAYDLYQQQLCTQFIPLSYDHNDPGFTSKEWIYMLRNIVHFNSNIVQSEFMCDRNTIENGIPKKEK